MNYLFIKSSAKLTSRHFDDECATFYRCILDKWPETSDGKVVITSGWRAPKRETQTFHDKCRAWDVRTHNIRVKHSDLGARKTFLLNLAQRMKRRLGSDWDVAHHPELANTDSEHLHFELDEHKGDHHG